MKLLALDFDGVISDSAPEAWMVALRTWADLRPDPVVIALRDAAERATPAEIRTNPQYRAFVDMMPLGNNAADFAVALGLVAGDRRAADQAAFDRAFEEAGEAFLSRFYDRFYATRAAFRAPRSGFATRASRCLGWSSAWPSSS